jgi:hypothetical protein
MMKIKSVWWQKQWRVGLVVAWVGCSSLWAALPIFDSSGNGILPAPVTYGDWLAQGFKTPSVAYQLESVTIHLPNPPGAGGEFEVSLWSSSGIIPDISLAKLSGPSAPAGGANVYTPSSPITLKADTTYYVVSGVVNGGWPFPAYGWMGGLPPITPGPGTPEGVAVSFDQGANWLAYSDPKIVVLAMQVNVVPEPGEWALLGGGLCLGFALLRRRFRK